MIHWFIKHVVLNNRARQPINILNDFKYLLRVYITIVQERRHFHLDQVFNFFKLNVYFFEVVFLELLISFEAAAMSTMFVDHVQADVLFANYAKNLVNFV